LRLSRWRSRRYASALAHASSKAETDERRRVLHIEYADALTLGNGLELAVA
jgi:hypothetical protein